jgi:hypothetical protein
MPGHDNVTMKDFREWYKVWIYRLGFYDQTNYFLAVLPLIIYTTFLVSVSSFIKWECHFWQGYSKD